jgi:hypothetical protein
MTFSPPWYWLIPPEVDLERAAAEILAATMPRPPSPPGAAPSWLIAELNRTQVRIALDFWAMGIPMRLSIAKAIGLTPGELDLYEAGREIGDEGILDRIADARVVSAREPGEE